MKITIIAVVAIAVIAVGASLWVGSHRRPNSEAASRSQSTPQNYDTSGGQEMRPRWNE